MRDDTRANDPSAFPAEQHSQECSTYPTPVANSIPGRKRNYTSKILKSKFALGAPVSGLMDSLAGVPVRGKFHENWRVQTAYRSSNTRRARPACKPSACDGCRAENGSCSPTVAAPARAWTPNTCSCYPVLPESTEACRFKCRTISIFGPARCLSFPSGRPAGAECLISCSLSLFLRSDVTFTSPTVGVISARASFPLHFILRLWYPPHRIRYRCERDVWVSS